MPVSIMKALLAGSHAQSLAWHLGLPRQSSEEVLNWANLTSFLPSQAMPEGLLKVPAPVGQRRVEGMLKVCRRHVEGMLKACWRCVEGPCSCPARRHVEGALKACWRHVEGMLKVPAPVLSWVPKALHLGGWLMIDPSVSLWTWIKCDRCCDPGHDTWWLPTFLCKSQGHRQQWLLSQKLSFRLFSYSQLTLLQWNW